MISRRESLKLLGLSAAGLVGGTIFPRFRFKPAHAQSASKHVLVALNISGGWDGQHVMPFLSGVRYDAQLAARPQLTRNPSTQLNLNGEVGLHSSLTYLQDQFFAGNLLACQTAGIHRNNSGSHESAAMDVFNAQADGNADVRSKGFLADILDIKYSGGTTAEFLAFDGNPGGSVLNGSTTKIIKALSLQGLGFNGAISQNDRGFTQDYMYLLASGEIENDQTGKVKATVKALEATQTKIKEAVQNTVINPAFPNTGIGNAFKQIFYAVAAFPTEVEGASVSYGGWDTHNMQDPIVQAGQALQGMSANLKNMDDALRAFYQNLKRIGRENEVTTYISSEFGRTARQNGGVGTDHGWGTTYFLLGGAVAGGRIIGNLIAPADFNSGNNSFPVSVPTHLFAKHIAERMGVPATSLYPVPTVQELIAINDSLGIGNMFK